MYRVHSIPSGALVRLPPIRPLWAFNMPLGIFRVTEAQVNFTCFAVPYVSLFVASSAPCADDTYIPMSSLSQYNNGSPPAIASSSRSSLAEDRDNSDDGLDRERDELLNEEDPLHENGQLDRGFVYTHVGRCVVTDLLQRAFEA